MLTIPEASSRPGFWLGLTRLEADVPRIVAQAVQLAEIPSPTGAEEARAAAVRDLFTEALGMARIDQAGNVAAVLAGATGRPGTVILAPLDSWYESIEQPHIQVRPDRLTGPGIAGQSIALAVQVALARTLRERPVQGLGDIWFIATVGSEMSGDLRGICHLFPWLPTVADRVICLQGPGLGRLDHWSVGTYRGELAIWAPGGHCWRDVGRPNALRLAMNFSMRMDSVPNPGLPRSLYNPAQLESGDAWNTLPSKAVLRFELRSDGEAELQKLIREAQSAAGEICKGLSGCRAELSQKGFRHATGLYLDHPLVIGTREAQSWAGLVPRLGASSSDASVCLHYGVASVTIGLASVVGLETQMESLYLESLPMGLRQAYAVLVQVAGEKIAMTPEAWLFRNSFLPSREAPASFMPSDLQIGLCLLTRNAAFTLGRHLLLLKHGWPGGLAPWSEILVADLGSTDSTLEIAREHGAVVLEPAERLAATLEPGADGDGLMRALAATKSDILLVVPSNLIRLDMASIACMVRTLLDDASIQLCLAASEVDGGPLSTLGTRPVLAALHPELAVVIDPTTPLLALRTSGIRELPIARTAGYECALVVDCRAVHGLPSLAQVRVPLEWEVADPRLDPGRAFKTLVALLEALRRTGHISTTRELGHLFPSPREWGDSGPRLVTSLEVFPWTKT